MQGEDWYGGRGVGTGGWGRLMGPWEGGLEIPNGSSLNLGKLVFSYAKWEWQYPPHDVGVILLTNIY